MNDFNPKIYVSLEAAWLAFRRRWLLVYPPLDNGSYICGICGGWVSGEEVTLDHIKPRTAENMFSVDNVQPAHGACNYRKGSKRWQPKVTKEMYDFLNELSNIQ